MPGQQNLPLRLHWVKDVCLFGVSCHLHFWQYEWGLLCATAVRREQCGQQVRVSTGSELRGKNSPTVFAGCQTGNLLIMSPLLYQLSNPNPLCYKDVVW